MKHLLHSLKVYTGVGSRDTPTDVLELMRSFAFFMAGKHALLRSGGADGADKAFEDGASAAKGPRAIFLPWKGFNRNDSWFCEPSEYSKCIAKQVHPLKDKLEGSNLLFHARNVHQIFGHIKKPEDLLKDVTQAVICWTPEAKATGGTATVIKLAEVYGIPLFNLANEHHRVVIEESLKR